MNLRITLLIEGVLSFAANLLFIGIFFYTKQVFGWGLMRNFLLASAQGAVYVLASLASQKVAKRVGDRRLLIFSNLALAGVSAVGVIVSSPAILTGVIILYVPLMALNWPVLEAAAAVGADPHTLSRRIGMYNLIWAGTGALAVAVQGTLLKIDARMVFVVPFAIHVAIVGIIVAFRGYGVLASSTAEDRVAEATQPTGVEHVHVDPEPALLRQRTLALWLSRIALPSTYVVIYSLSALMPLLPVMQGLDTTAQTAVGSVWMVSRWLAFWILGATVFWHTRPMLLLGAAVLMGAAFVGVTAPVGLGGMIAAQVLLGAALGLIYTASLYFGMVLSEGSAEHAGYHEALIGLGQVLGPGAGALTQWRWEKNLFAGVAAVSSLVLVSVVAAGIAAAKARRRA
ncbi:MAG: Major Facilitator Superfamily protein [Phycisphaerales bacterium]|nr:Major Facilitator Superfamily protein [Phycisphaerales bacterium]